MKIKYISFVVAFVLFSITANSQSKLGTVNVNDILTHLPELTEVETAMKTYRADLDKILNEKTVTYKSKVELFKKNADTYSDIMKKTMGEELYGLEDDIKKFQQNGVKLVQIRQEELLRPLYAKISNMIAEVAKEQNYTQVLTIEGNEFAYIDEKLDITSIVKTRLGIKK